MKRLFLLFTFLAASAHAGTITLSSVGGSRFATKSGSLLPAGCAVRVGTFELPAASRDAVLNSQGDYAWLKSVFKPLAEGLIGAGGASQASGSGSVLRANGFPAAGDIFGSISGIDASYLPPDTQLYVWIFNHSNPDQATQWGLFTATAWTAPPALGSRTLSTTAAVQALQGTTVSSQLRLIDVPATYGNWTWQNYTLSAPAQLTQATADPDGDGVANIAEYAWKLNPAARSEPRTELTPPAGGTFTFRFKRPRHLPGVTVIAECSSDLKTWQPASAAVTASDADFDTLESSASTATPCFWRIRFEPVP
jgi:hypothetical protein